MSDYEDEMDVDAPSKVQFASDNASGKKRTAADLPISALDNLPWYALTYHSKQFGADSLDRVEKYRPTSLDDVSGHQDILTTINRFVEANVFSRNISTKLGP
jgi:replication factor C subunit 3/5